MPSGRKWTGWSGISPEVRASAQVAAGNQNHNPSITGVGADYVHIRSWDVLSGENFTETDVRNASKVALIGKTAAETLFGEGAEPVGEIIRIKNAPFTDRRLPQAQRHEHDGQRPGRRHPRALHQRR